MSNGATSPTTPTTASLNLALSTRAGSLAYLEGNANTRTTWLHAAGRSRTQLDPGLVARANEFR